MQPAISVIETDCEVDFAPPLDYVEPDREEGPAVANGGADALLNGTASTSGAVAAAGQAQAPEEPPEPKFAAFGGAGRRLDGKAVAPAPAPQPGPSSAPGPSNRPSPGEWTVLGLYTLPVDTAFRRRVALNMTLECFNPVYGSLCSAAATSSALA